MKKKVKGIGGWLLIFIILQIVGFIGSVQLLFEQNFTAPLLIGLGLSTWGVWISYTILKTKPQAITYAKEYLIVSLLSGILTLIFVAVQTTELIKYGIAGFIGSLALTIIWIAYFNNSIRIKNTFPQQQNISLKRTSIITLLVLILQLLFYTL